MQINVHPHSFPTYQTENDSQPYPQFLSDEWFRSVTCKPVAYGLLGCSAISQLAIGILEISRTDTDSVSAQGIFAASVLSYNIVLVPVLMNLKFKGIAASSFFLNVVNIYLAIDSIFLLHSKGQQVEGSGILRLKIALNFLATTWYVASAAKIYLTQLNNEERAVEVIP